MAMKRKLEIDSDYVSPVVRFLCHERSRALLTVALAIAIKTTETSPVPQYGS